MHNNEETTAMDASWWVTSYMLKYNVNLWNSFMEFIHEIYLQNYLVELMCSIN